MIIPATKSAKIIGSFANNRNVASKGEILPEVSTNASNR